MSFETEGFFSADMAQFRAAVNNQEPTKAWFDFARDLSRFVLEMIRGQKTPPVSDTQRFPLAALAIRAHQSFQAAVMLAENGMIGDARAGLRSATEGVIAMFGLAADPAFADRLDDDYRLNQRKSANVVLAEPTFAARYPAAELAQMRATVREVDAIRADRGLDVIKWDPDRRQALPRSLPPALPPTVNGRNPYQLGRHPEIHASRRKRPDCRAEGWPRCRWGG
jgi:hypothetical protein